jgi:5-oxopent-3-ene-1,2,5-tricarboxylate decarboxylase/2-hydroxyhepta-2,4-diene-1,7-dioate isomerase
VFKASKGFDVRTALITVSINGQIVEQRTLEAQVRPIDTLLCDVTDFMTLQQADVMLLGLSDQPPLAQPGDQITIDVAALGRLQFLVTLEDEEAS